MNTNKELSLTIPPHFIVFCEFDFLENQIFSLLYAQRNNICHFQYLLQAWDSKFVELHSLYRVISSLRKKLQKSGVNYEIVSKSKIGYMLKSL